MKKYYVYLFGLLLFISSCKEAPLQIVETNDPNEYPSKVGSIFYFDIDSVTTGGTNYNIGKRKSIFNNFSQLRGIEYISQFDSTVISGASTLATSYFRKTSVGVYYYVDTTAFESLIPAEIPDSIRSLIKIDSEILILSFPLQIGKYWDAFTISVFNIPILEMKAFVYTKSNIVLNLNNEEKPLIAQRIIFELSIINDPQNINDKTKFDATGWYVNGLGFVKFEGSSLIQSILAGGTIVLQDEESNIIQTMTGYNF